MDNPIQTFEANTVGRDFVIGDLHGAFELFLKLLENIKFDPTIDRIFSVGDLIDRGPDSMSCLRLIEEPWFHCVLANHEQMMLECLFGGYMGQYWFQNGGFWGYKFAEHLTEFQKGLHGKLNDETAEFMRLVDIVKELPYIMTIDLVDGTKAHVIHAELPPNQIIIDSDLSSPGRVMELATTQSHDGDFMVWGRHKFYPFYRAQLDNREKCIRQVAAHYRHPKLNPKLSKIISGHTILQRPMTVLGQTNIDTCAYDAVREDASSWSGLTCIELNPWKFTQTTPIEFREVQPVVINTSDVNAVQEQL